MKISALFKDGPDIDVTGLAIDSRTVKKGDIYFCINGMVNDGHDFVDAAISEGAICIIYSKDIKHMKAGVVYIKVEDVNHTLNLVASKFYGEPSKKMLMFGVTGTNGKTTVANIIKDCYSHFVACGYIGTISIAYNDVSLPPTLTTPDPIMLHKTLADMLAHGVLACSLEVSSHGLELGRVESVDFDIAIFTNLTHDHLDFHGTVENYFNAKKKLFVGLKENGIAVLNHDDPYFAQLQEATKAKVVSYGQDEKATYRITDIQIGQNGSSFSIVYQEKSYLVKTNLLAIYNIYNLSAALAAMSESGISLAQLIPFVEHISQIDGRMESIDEGQSFKVFVDFAHTPDGLDKVYSYAKQIISNNGKIIAVFGSAGKRDSKKRKLFGEVASKYCDMIILTEDDPRDESAKVIADEIKEGITGVNNIFIEKRYDAIRQAIESANANDIVLLLGKGDETFMYGPSGKEPWIGDHIAARKCIQKYVLGEEKNDL